MATALLLFGYALAAGTVGTSALHESGWVARSPRLAIVAWQALAASVLLAVGAAGLAMAVSLPHVGDDFASLLDLCAETLRVGYASPGGVAPAAFGAALFLALSGRMAWCVATSSTTDRRDRARRIRTLDLVGDPDLLPGAVVLEHAEAYAFCVGGRAHRVVVTSGLLAVLSREELAAVLAHEDAHGRQRHHRALLLCSMLLGTLAPVLPGFRNGMSDVRLFLELRADDCARARVGTRPLLTALAQLACRPAPGGTLAASGLNVVARVRRLEEDPPTLGVTRTIATALIITTGVIVPLLMAVAPAVTMAWEGICLIA